jgi:hypothetical protein
MSRKRSLGFLTHDSFSNSLPPIATCTLGSRDDTGNLRTELASLWEAGELCDIKLSVNGRTFEAHRVMLVATSGYFKGSLIGAGATMASVSIHELSELSAPTFKALLTFMYKGTCTFNESCLTEVLEAASRLLMPALQEAAVGAMIARLNEANAIASWGLADRLMLSELSSHALEYVSFHFQTIAASDAWLSAPLQLVLRLLPQDELEVKEEEAVFRAAVRWVRAQERQPNESEMRSLFAAVRFPLLSFSFVQLQVQPEPLLAAPWAKDLLTTSLLRFVHGVEKSLPRERYPKLRVLNCSSEGGLEDEDGSHAHSGKAVAVLDATSIHPHWHTDGSTVEPSPDHLHWIELARACGDVPVCRLGMYRHADFDCFSPSRLRIKGRDDGDSEWMLIKTLSLGPAGHENLESGWVELLSHEQGQSRQVRVEIIENVDGGYDSKVAAFAIAPPGRPWPTVSE